MGAVTRLKPSLDKRVSDLEEFRERVEPTLDAVSELVPLMKTATKLFKIWAPVIAAFCGAAAVASGRDELRQTGDVIASIAAGIQ